MRVPTAHRRAISLSLHSPTPHPDSIVERRGDNRLEGVIVMRIIAQRA